MNIFSSLLFAVTFISGVNPELHTFNREGECGTGAVVPWAGSLWAVSYAPHAPNGSTDLLYEVKPDFSRTIHREVAIGGTPANRLVHRESNQLFIGPYAIDAKGGIRVMKPINPDGSTNLYGRLTASARHLFDPAHKIYTMTMEEGVYEIDVDTLKVTELFRDGNIQGYGKHDGDLLPGYHGKGGYTGQGRLVYANNGEFSPAAMKDPTTTSGVLAQWNGKPGKENWEIVLRNQFTDVTSKGGIYGAADPAKDPLWAVGWDYKSVILMILEDGSWHKYRLPKGSHSYDGAHGWNTEWPRIREIGEGDDYLMTMHGTFWHFPATMSAKNSAGIRPRSNYLKIVGDFCRWGDKLVLGCDDTAANEFLNKRRAKGGLGAPRQSNSSLWFLDPADLDGFGPAIGRGAVWQEEDVKAGQVSDPYLLDGFDRRMLFVAGDLEAAIEIDVKGDGAWTRVADFTVAACNGVSLDNLRGAWIRLVALKDAKKVTAFFNYANRDRRRRADAMFDGLAANGAEASRGILRSGRGDENLPLEMVQDGQLYLMTPGEGGRLRLVKTDDAKTRDDVVKWMRLDPREDLGDSYDAASAIVTDDAGRRWRFPRANNGPRTGRLCRECCTERDLLNLAGVFYELPAENAGGFAKVRAIATHDRGVYDYCTWRGLFVISGVAADAAAGEHIVRSDDGRAALWVGVADDLWKLGRPRGSGGVWKDTAVSAGVPSDPFLMTGFDRKRLTLAADRDATVKVEIDVTGSGTWIALRSYRLAAGETVADDLSAIRAYWIRATSDTDCTATMQLEYR
ncbi:MAG: hypothetical protein IIY62_04205 [Kiritimatiellae bacterium]|nr:hypothetical protein [Kiritimatiellia bacterium]